MGGLEAEARYGVLWWLNRSRGEDQRCRGAPREAPGELPGEEIIEIYKRVEKNNVFVCCFILIFGRAFILRFPFGNIFVVVLCW